MKHKDNILVSCIVPTKNSELTLEECLYSLKLQKYKNLEIIVVDNHSKDKTLSIAKKYTNRIFTMGPERSAQRNFGVKKSNGSYVVFIDSDMQLSENVIEDCVELIKNNNLIGGIVIPEESFGKGFWSKCKKLERSFYVGIDWIEAPRFFNKKYFLNVGGYDENLISGEDWDLSEKIKNDYQVSRINSYILHNEGNLSLLKTISKKFYYAKEFKNYTDKNYSTKNSSFQTSPILRYKLFLSKPKCLFRNPIIGVGMLFMKTCEFLFGALGYVYAKIN